MQFLRKVALVAATSLLPIFLFSFGLSFSLYQIYGAPDRIKAALQQSGVYDTFIGDVLAQVKTEEGEGQGDDIPVDRPEIKNIIQQAAPPAFLQQQTEGLLDGLYTWMRGEGRLDLEIDLTDAKNQLANGLAQYASDRLATLPACGAPVAAQDFDALNATCLPSGADRAAAVEKVRQEILGGEFLKDPVITEDDIKNKQGKPLEEQMQAIPGVYSLLVLDIWASGLLVLLMAAAIILLRVPRRAGVKRVAIVLIIVGAISAALAWAGSALTGKLADSLTKSGESNIQATLAEIVNILMGNLRTWWLGYSLIILGVGVAILITLRFVKAKPAEEDSSAEPPVKDKKSKPSSALSTKPPKALG